MSSTSSTPARSSPRRHFLRGLLGFALAGLARVPVVFAAAGRPNAAFAAEELASALEALYGTATFPTSDKIRIGVAKLAENGAVVPVKVDVDLPHVEEIALFASRNPVPLVARFSFGPRTRPFVATRIKLKETSEVIAVVRSRDGILMARTPVEVTVGGCG